MATRLESSSDCTRCAALCCIAYPSENMPGFAAAKEAGQPCPKLGHDGLCTIYADRAEQVNTAGKQHFQHVVHA